MNYKKYEKINEKRREKIEARKKSGLTQEQLDHLNNFILKIIKGDHDTGMV